MGSTSNLWLVRQVADSVTKLVFMCRPQWRVALPAKAPGAARRRRVFNRDCLMTIWKPRDWHHCAMDGSGFTILGETPCAEPPVRRIGAGCRVQGAGCCGGWGLNTPGYPIKASLIRTQQLHLALRRSAHYRRSQYTRSGTDTSLSSRVRFRRSQKAQTLPCIR